MPIDRNKWNDKETQEWEECDYEDDIHTLGIFPKTKDLVLIER